MHGGLPGNIWNREAYQYEGETRQQEPPTPPGRPTEITKRPGCSFKANNAAAVTQQSRIPNRYRGITQLNEHNA